MMLRHLGWNEAPDLVVRGWTALAPSTWTYDFARLMEAPQSENIGVRG